MARTTDRQHISEAVRLAVREGKTWGVYRETKSGRMTQDLFNDRGHELNIEYAPSGRITKLVHWQPVGGGPEDCASRQPIYQGKREYALAVIRGEDPQ